VVSISIVKGVPVPSFDWLRATVPELTRGADIKLNTRVSLRAQSRPAIDQGMKKRASKPQDRIRDLQKGTETLRQEYSDLLRLREKVRRLVTLRRKSGKRSTTLH
jgi:hypothetical protein